MKKLGLWLVFTLAGVVFPLQAWGEHEIKYRISPLGNLVYQLDCMAQVARFQCSRGDFNHLWQSAIEAGENDAKMLQKWHELRAQLDESIEFGDGEDMPMVTTANYPMNAANN